MDTPAYPAPIRGAELTRLTLASEYLKQMFACSMTLLDGTHTLVVVGDACITGRCEFLHGVFVQLGADSVCGTVNAKTVVIHAAAKVKLVNAHTIVLGRGAKIKPGWKFERALVCTPTAEVWRHGRACYTFHHSEVVGQVSNANFPDTHIELPAATIRCTWRSVRVHNLCLMPPQ